MGCGDSKDAKKDMPGQRSAQIGQEEPQTPKSPKPKQEVSECNEMIESLKMVNIIQLTGTVFDTGRMVSVGSVTTGKQNDFDEKPMDSDPRIKENDLGGLLTETFQQTQAMVVAA